MTSSSKSIPEWKLERLALGELPEAEAAELRARIDSNPAEAARLEALEESNRAILAAHPPAEMLQEIERRRHLQEVTEREASRPAARPLSRSLLFGLPSLAAAATLAVVLLQGPPPVTVDPFPPEHIIIKGLDSKLHIHRQTEAGAEELKDGALARQGDLLQLAYTAASKRHGLIASLDGRGTVTVHLAGRGDLHSAALEPSGKVHLGQAYELDDAPRFERFFFFASDAPFETESILAAVKATGDRPLELELPGIEYLTFDIRKETP